MGSRQSSAKIQPDAALTPVAADTTVPSDICPGDPDFEDAWNYLDKAGCRIGYMTYVKELLLMNSTPHDPNYIYTFRKYQTISDRYPLCGKYQGLSLYIPKGFKWSFPSVDIVSKHTLPWNYTIAFNPTENVFYVTRVCHTLVKRDTTSTA